MDYHHVFNGAASLLAAIALSHVVLSPFWQEGIVAKLGLIVMIFSLLATSALTLLVPGECTPDWESLWNAGTGLRLGMVLVVVGYYLRRKQKGYPLRRYSDWVSLEPHEEPDGKRPDPNEERPRSKDHW